MPAGRPSKYNPEKCEEAKSLLSQGYSKEATAGALGIGKTALYDWIERYPEFANAIKEGEAASQQWWEDRGRKSCDGDNFNATVWVMTMKNRFNWRDKQEITGEDGGPLAVKIVKEYAKDG